MPSPSADTKFVMSTLNFDDFGILKKDILQLNLLDLLFRYLRNHLTQHCSSISEDLHRFARNLQYMNAKLLFFLNNFLQASPKNNNRNNFAVICCKKLLNNNNNYAFVYRIFLANQCKSSDILEQCHVKWWLNYSRVYLKIWVYSKQILCQQMD